MLIMGFSWNPESGQFVWALVWAVVGFTCYYLLSSSKSVAGRIWKTNPYLDRQVRQVILQRSWGLLLLGIASAAIVHFILKGNLREYGLGSSFQSPLPWWTYPIVPFILIAGYFMAVKPGNLAHYPQFRIKEWSIGLLVLSGASWVLFLIGYEFLFRGFLLHSSLNVMGPVPAIALNCLLYAMAHFYKNRGEIIGAIPVGVVFCILTILTGNIWSAVVIHSIMALSNEWFSIRANPELKIKVHGLKQGL